MGENDELARFDESDERPHAIGSELGWAEAYRFDLLDPEQGLGGFMELTVRPNQGAMEVGLHFLLADGGLIVARQVKAVEQNTADLEVGDARFAMDAPLARWKVSYDGPAHSLASAREAASPGAWRKSRIERLGVDLALEATSPAFGEPGGFRQALRWSGTVWVSGDEYPIACLGQRSRSWGVDDVETARGARMLWVAFADDFAVAAALSGDDRGGRRHGWVLHRGEAAGLREIELSAERDPESGFQRRLDLSLKDGRGRFFEMSGDLLQTAPLPRTRGAGRAVVRESMVRFVCGAATGFGFATEVDEIDTGDPPRS